VQLTFDLRDLSETRFFNLRFGRVFALVITVFFASLEATILLGMSGVWPGFKTKVDPTGFVLAGGCLFIVTMSLLFYFTDYAFRSATTLEIDDRGVRLVRPSGSPRGFFWSDPKFSLNVAENLATSRPRRRQSERASRDWEYAVLGLRPRYTPISREAFASLMAESKRRDMVVKVGKQYGSPWNPTIYKIRPPA